ncbi:MAG: hypothetical protein M3419_08045 [Actinomycetota bacterium]|nr:hypothetical protein [Actinomycetota bacterium]
MHREQVERAVEPGGAPRQVGGLVDGVAQPERAAVSFRRQLPPEDVPASGVYEQPRRLHLEHPATSGCWPNQNRMAPATTGSISMRTPNRRECSALSISACHTRRTGWG